MYSAPGDFSFCGFPFVSPHRSKRAWRPLYFFAVLHFCFFSFLLFRATLPFCFWTREGFESMPPPPHFFPTQDHFSPFNFKDLAIKSEASLTSWERPAVPTKHADYDGNPPMSAKEEMGLHNTEAPILKLQGLAFFNPSPGETRFSHGQFPDAKTSSTTKTTTEDIASTENFFKQALIGTERGKRKTKRSANTLERGSTLRRTQRHLLACCPYEAFRKVRCREANERVDNEVDRFHRWQTSRLLLWNTGAHQT